MSRAAACVDEPALNRALKSGTILAAGLDVFEREPNVPDELKAMQNVVLAATYRFGFRGNAQRHGSAGGGQSEGLVRRKAAADAGCGDAREGER